MTESEQSGYRGRTAYRAYHGQGDDAGAAVSGGYVAGIAEGGILPKGGNSDRMLSQKQTLRDRSRGLWTRLAAAQEVPLLAKLAPYAAELATCQTISLPFSPIRNYGFPMVVMQDSSDGRI